MISRFAVGFSIVAACGAPTVPPQPTAAPPKLVVLLILDQWPEWAFEVKRPALTGGGFERLLREGRWYVGEHPSAATLTGPGHALLGTGAPSHASGIVANEWFHRDLDKRMKSIEDGEGASASWLRVAGLGDSIAKADSGAKAVSIALKDRSAILSLGHAGTAIWYEKKPVAWVSPQRPAWLAAHNTAQPLSARIHEVWAPLDPARLAKLSGTVDAAPGEVGEKKFGPTFPHAPDATGDPADALFAVPAGNTVLLDAAVAAIAGEPLGSDASPDLLILSLSAHDYFGHGWGQESWEMWDATIRLDRDLTRFLDELDRRVGRNQWSMIVTSDHGASPLPERAGNGGRIDEETIHEVANRAAVSVLGPGTWVADAKYPNIYFSRALLATSRHERERAIEAITREVRAIAGIAWVEPLTRYAGNCAARAGDDRVVCMALDVERSGDLIYMTKPHWILQELDEPLATAHGSIYLYDRLVPVIVLAPDRTLHAPATTPESRVMPMTEVAPLLARWLGVRSPLDLPRP